MVAGVAAAGLLSLGVGGGVASASQLATSARSAVSTFPTKGGILFGGTDGLAKQTAALGRNLAIIRVYYKIGDTFPSFVDSQHMAQGSTVLVSLDSSGQDYTSIAAGQYDTQISAFLAAVNTAAVQNSLSAIFISFEHEPDGPQHASLGTAAQFVAAWQHVHQLAADASLNWNQNAGGRLLWTLILTAHSYAIGTNAGGYWPGTGQADLVAADGYNRFGCGTNPQKTPTTLFTPLLKFATANGALPSIIAEYGSNAADPTAQAAFIAAMQTYLVNHHKKIKAADYWDDTTTTCDFRVDANPGSLAALNTLGASPVMQGTAHNG